MAEIKNYFDSLRQISRTFNTTFDEKELVQVVVDTTIETLQLKAASVYLINESTNEIMPMHHKGLSNEYLASGLTGPEMITPILRKNGYLLARDAASDPQLDHHEAKAREGIGSILIVPVKAVDRVIGIISSYSAEQRDFSPEDIDFVAAMGEQAGYAIEHARVVERLRENNRLLLDFTTSINSTLKLKNVLHILAADIAERFDVKGSSILLFDEQREKLCFMTGYGLSERYAARDRLVVEESVRQTLEGNTVFIEDAQTDERVKYKDSKKEEGIVTILSVPIMAHSRVLGALRLYSGVRRQFSEDELMLIQSLGQIGGLAIQNATLYTRLREDMKDLEEEVWSHRLWF
jgi:GAF domain-containing protein